MKILIQITIAFIAVLTLSACGITEPIKNQQTSNATSTITEQDSQEMLDPMFMPLYSQFHMGPIISLTGNFMKFPVQMREVKSVSVKFYKVSKENFIKLQKQQLGMLAHEGKLDLSNFSKDEQTPVFEGPREIIDTGWLIKPNSSTNESPRRKGYIELPMTQDEKNINQGYYYMEFESPEMLKFTGMGDLHSLFEIVETYQGHEEQYEGIAIPR